MFLASALLQSKIRGIWQFVLLGLNINVYMKFYQNDPSSKGS